ncbi:HEXXH motif domain-containing protein [Solwaraspora sp. WMMD1047]|uniref:HEXXH motif domain-containing protein n=1 Tax=Solwaraspora sp. WMMD1047 TaxID=3016102 RepID=UPI0024175CE5|nr:HEXXH motif domain-containing protein [Solwaraspora sp. WMMD1047]MDG4833530.1 HEXXH motif domain-containing protein [Solwaraspora sp. WMMD1047]
MNVELYRLSHSQFLSIASGHGRPDAIEVLAASQRSKRRLLLLAIIQCVAGSELAATVGAAVELLVEAEHVRKDVVRAVLAYPFFDNWASSWLNRLAQAGAAATTNAALRDDLSHLTTLAVAAAVQAGIPVELTVPSRDGVVVLPTLGAAVGLGAGEVRIIVDRSRVVFTGSHGAVVVPRPVDEPAPGWEPVRSVRVEGASDGHVLAIEDLDPNRDCYQWQVAQRLDEENAERFADHCRRAWALIVAHHPEHAAGMRRALKSLTPLAQTAAGTSQGATSFRAFGSLAVSMAAHPENLAMSMIHEFQHMKLSAVEEIHGLYRSRSGSYFAPWRLDPRPIHALMHGAYAHTGVCDFWRRRRTVLVERPAVRTAHYEFALWRRLTMLAADSLLAAPELTARGRQFAGQLRATLIRWGREPVPTEIDRATADAALAYEVRWRLVHGRPEPEDLARLARAPKPRWLRVDPAAVVRVDRPPPAAVAVGPAEPAFARMIRVGTIGAAPAGQPDPAAAGAGPPEPGTDLPFEPALRDGDRAYLAGRFRDARAAYAAAIDGGCHSGWVGFAVATARSARVGQRWARQIDLLRQVHAAGQGRVGAAEVARWWLDSGRRSRHAR